jgi:hypothetical protein
MVVVFTDICVFCFSILMSVDPQKCSLVWYTLQYGVAQNPLLYSWHLNFVLFLCFWRNTRQHWILLHCISLCLLCLVSSLFSWLVDGACLPCLAVKMPNGVAVFVITHWDPAVNMWTTGTLGRHFVLSIEFVKFVSVMLSVSLSVSL